MNRKVFMAATVAALCTAGSAWAQSDACKDAVASALSNYGVKWADLKNVQWDVDTWNTSGHGNQTTISGYQMYAEPAQCAGGSIVAEMGSDCGISDVFTRGDCKIKGLPNHWW